MPESKSPPASGDTKTAVPAQSVQPIAAAPSATAAVTDPLSALLDLAESAEVVMNFTPYGLEYDAAVEALVIAMPAIRYAIAALQSPEKANPSTGSGRGPQAADPGLADELITMVGEANQQPATRN